MGTSYLAALATDVYSAFITSIRCGITYTANESILAKSIATGHLGQGRVK